jgi:hypothetical protein
MTAPPGWVHPLSYQDRCGPGVGGTGFGVTNAVRGAGHRLPSCVGVRPIRPANSLVLAALIEKIWSTPQYGGFWIATRTALPSSLHSTNP